jgi:hypothetical protein
MEKDQECMQEFDCKELEGISHFKNKVVEKEDDKKFTFFLEERELN